MNIEDEIHAVISDEEERLKSIFIRVIDESVLYCKNNNFNSVDTYLYVYDKIDELFKYVLSYYGYTSNDNEILSYSFICEIYDYINYLSLEATEELRKKALKLLDISYLGFFIDEFNEFKKILDQFDKRDIRPVYECIKIRRLENNGK